MRQGVSLIMPAANRGFICAISVVASCFAGCIPNLPVVSQQGKIVGGHPKLNDLLRRIKNMRDEHALADRSIIEAVYVAWVRPTPQTVSWHGILPPTDKAVAAHYYLVCARETLGKASVAVVTQFLVVRRNGASQTDTYNVLLFWRDNQWEESGIIRMPLGAMRAREPPVSPGETEPRSTPALRRVFPAAK